VVGTRPEIIRLIKIAGMLWETIEHIIVHTGQKIMITTKPNFLR
jgi:UDP-N-acetylglucosamine 2-epimerase